MQSNSELRDEQSHGMETNRIEALSDGVFAIAMTILTFSITIPSYQQVSAHGFGHALVQMLPQLMVYVITFVNLGVLWVGQHNQYHFIARADRWFIWINMLYLMLIALLPLSTALLGRFPMHRAALAIYGVNLIGATLVLGLHWQYAARGLLLKEPDAKAMLTRLAHRRIVQSIVGYTVAIAAGFYLPVIGLVLFLLVPIANIFPYRVDEYFRHQRP